MRANLIQLLKMYLAPSLYTAYKSSLRINLQSIQPEGVSPRIFACLHRDILPAILHVAPTRPVLLISRSGDGDILQRILGERDYTYVRGSTGSEGGEAFRKLLGRLRSGRDIGLAVDGPRGPFGKIHIGVLLLARLSGSPIVPLVIRAGGHIKLGNWDRTLIPLPFTRIRVETGTPLQIPRDTDVEALAVYAQRLKEALLPPGVER